MSHKVPQQFSNSLHAVCRYNRDQWFSNPSKYASKTSIIHSRKALKSGTSLLNFGPHTVGTKVFTRIPQKRILQKEHFYRACPVWQWWKLSTYVYFCLEYRSLGLGGSKKAFKPGASMLLRNNPVLHKSHLTENTIKSSYKITKPHSGSPAKIALWTWNCLSLVTRVTSLKGARSNSWPRSSLRWQGGTLTGVRLDWPVRFTVSPTTLTCERQHFKQCFKLKLA